MRDWSQIKAETVFEGNDEDGNRYLSQFLKDYQDTFEPDVINAGCRRCLEDYYRKLTLSLHKMKKVINSGYRLKKKYEGVSLAFGSPIQIFNSNLSDELAEKLIKNHPAGKDLFEAFPEEKTGDQGNTPDEGDNAQGPAGNDPGDQKPTAEEKIAAEAARLKKLKRAQVDEEATSLGIDASAFSKKEEVIAVILEVLQANVNE